MSRWTKHRKKIRKEQEAQGRNMLKAFQSQWDSFHLMITESHYSDEDKAKTLEVLRDRPTEEEFQVKRN